MDKQLKLKDGNHIIMTDLTELEI